MLLKRLTLLCLLNYCVSGLRNSTYNSSLTFVIDDTGSMGDDIGQVKIGVDAIFDTVLTHNKSQIENFIIVTFNDIHPESLKIHTDLSDTKLLAKTKKHDEFKAALESIDVHGGGGDCVEYALSGVKRGIESSFPESIIFVYTDAPAKDYVLYESLKSLALTKQCQVNFVVTDTNYCHIDPEDIGTKVYYDLARNTQGQVFELDKSEIGQILEYVKDAITERKYTLVNKELPPGKNNVTIPVDPTTKNVTVAVNGRGSVSTVSLTSPCGSMPPMKTITKTNKITIINFQAMCAGDYTIYVEGDSKKTLLASGTSSVQLMHGFSTIKPTSLQETSSRPIPDVKSYLSIAVIEGDIQPVAVKFRDMDKKLISFTANDNTSVLETPLIKFNDKFYLTEPILPPNSTFLLAIICYDSKSNTNFTRLSRPIEYQKIIPGDIKYVPSSVVIEGDANINIKFEDNLKIICKVKGYPRPDIVWRNADNGRILPSEVSIYELPNDYTNILMLDKVKENGTYECSATNAYGSDFKRVSVLTVEPKPYLDVLGFYSERTFVEYDERAVLHCKVNSYPPAKITWQKRGKPVKSSHNIKISYSKNNSTLTIEHANVANNGMYICIADNKVLRQARILRKVIVTDIDRPKIDKSVSKITINESDFVDITCKTKPTKAPQTVLWSFRSTEIYANNKRKPQWNNRDSVHLQHVDRKDAGFYICEAKNEAGTDNHVTELVVQYSASVTTKGNKLMKIKKGETLKIDCEVDGIPTPKITWFKNGVRLSDSSVQLVRESVGPSNQGTYRCDSRNKVGADYRRVYVKVFYPANIYNQDPRDPNINVKVWDTVTMNCYVEGIPPPKVKWFYLGENGKEIGISKGEQLYLEHIQLKQEGQYICVASNSEGSSNFTYDVHVFAPPVIENHYLSNEFSAVEGDVALHLTCNATGHPKPYITWSKDGYNLALGTYYAKDGNDLIIMGITESSKGVYKCIAENKYGSDSEIFKVSVKKYVHPKTTTSQVHVTSGIRAEIPCNVNHTLFDRVGWYKNGVLIKTGQLILDYPKLADAGVYTCRVSNIYSSKSGDIKVIVGEKPDFLTDVDLTVKLEEHEEWTIYELNCDASGAPEPTITWYHDNEKLGTIGSTHAIELTVANIGKYTCEVKNDYGKIIRTFDVVSSDCFITTENLPEQPLLVSSNLRWPDYKTHKKQIVIPKDDKFLFYCPSQFKKFQSTYLLAFCDKNNKILVNGNQYEYSNLQCKEKVWHQVRKTGEKCLRGNTEKIKIEYELYFDGVTSTTEVYEVCFNKTSNMPIYAVHDMKSSAASVEIPTSWSDQDLFHVNFDDAYSCKRQANTISTSLGTNFHRSGDCCFSRRQLINPKDVFMGVPQTSTSSYFNVVPHWSTCHMENWNELEEKVRSFAKNAFLSDIKVWTGISGQLDMPNGMAHSQRIYIKDRGGDSQPVPKYLWKVVQDPWSRSSLAVIQLNIPDLSPSDVARHMPCKDICHKTDWMNGLQWKDANRGYIFCCSLREFENAFGYGNVFKPMYDVLQISDYGTPSIKSLTLT